MAEAPSIPLINTNTNTTTMPGAGAGSSGTSISPNSGALPPVRRFITTHDPATGRAVFDATVDPVVRPDPFPTISFFSCYSTSSFPTDLAADADIAEYRDSSYPSVGFVMHKAGGTFFRITDFAPSRPAPASAPAQEQPPAKEATKETSAPAPAPAPAPQQHADLLMHRTTSLDYGIVLEGEVEAILDSGETRVLRRGDVLVQRGTMHAWRNTSSTEPARMAFILVDIKPVVLPARPGDTGNQQEEVVLGNALGSADDAGVPPIIAALAQAHPPSAAYWGFGGVGGEKPASS